MGLMMFPRNYFKYFSNQLQQSSVLLTPRDVEYDGTTRADSPLFHTACQILLILV